VVLLLLMLVVLVLVPALLKLKLVLLVLMRIAALDTHRAMRNHSQHLKPSLQVLVIPHVLRSMQLVQICTINRRVVGIRKDWLMLVLQPQAVIRKDWLMWVLQ
jgi:hypothetical protein